MNAPDAFGRVPTPARERGRIAPAKLAHVVLKSADKDRLDNPPRGHPVLLLPGPRQQLLRTSDRCLRDPRGTRGLFQQRGFQRQPGGRRFRPGRGVGPVPGGGIQKRPVAARHRGPARSRRHAPGLPGHFPLADVQGRHPLAQTARRLIGRAPTRVIWGSDWPHPNWWKPMPNDADLLDLLLDWAPDPGRTATHPGG